MPHITVPGRPQSRTRNANGDLLQAGRDFLHTLRAAAAQHRGPTGAPLHPTGSLKLDIRLYYTNDHPLAPHRWHADNIPNADVAASLVLPALTGSIYSHASQANPLVVTRHVITPDEAIERWGEASARGCTVITWQA